MTRRICCSPSRRRIHAQMPATEEILERVGSVSKVPFPVWVSFCVLTVALTLGSTRMFRAGRRLWRDLGSFGTAVDDTSSGTAALPRLEAATARLRVSLARHAVLRAAVRDLQESVSGVVALYPRK